MKKISKKLNGRTTKSSSEHKPGDSAIFKSDYFDIYNVDKLRNMINPKGEDYGLEDIRDISKRIKDLYVTNDIYDKRSKAPKETKTMDYISFPLKPQNITTQVKLFLENK